MPASILRFLSKLWRPFLIVSSLLILYTLQITIFGFVPGISDPDSISMVMVSTLGVGLMFLILAFIPGCAHDIDKGGVIYG